MPLAFFQGTQGEVTFPEDFLWDLHRRAPGNIEKLIHTHPPGVVEASTQDKRLLIALAWALYPFPIRLSVLAPREILASSQAFPLLLEERCYWASLEPQSCWKAHGGERIVTILLESTHIIDCFDEQTPSYYHVLAAQSYPQYA